MTIGQETAGFDPAVVFRRVAIGLAQGILLYLMLNAADTKVWPATHRGVFEGLLFPLLFVPLAAIHADSHLPRRPLFIWLAAVTAMCGLVGVFDGYRFPGTFDQATWEPAALFASLALGLFLSEALLLAAHADGRRLASYPTYFEAISKHAVQVASAAVFVGALWLLLHLGAALFKLIKLNFLQDLIQEAWFAIPVSAMAVAVALHVTDVRGGLVRGIRTLAHYLLSWLMPILALIVAGFLASLPFTGLQPLWDTRFAAALLLGVSAILIVLINAVYQDGAADTQPRGLLRWAMVTALALPAPLVGIAGHALYLRVAQYGWTTERVAALACVLVAAVFAIGYLAVLVRGLKWLEMTNVAASIATIAALLALLTPIADPVRISVNSQVARLEYGRSAPDAFDYKYLRFDGGRYGAAALARMQAGEFKMADVAQRAAQAAGLSDRHGDEPLDQNGLALNIRAGGGRAVPPRFLAQDWRAIVKERGDAPSCLRRPAETCEAFLLDLNGDGADEIVLIPDASGTPPAVFQSEGDTWSWAGVLPRRLACADMRTRLRAGDFKVLPARMNDLDVGGVRMEMTARGDFGPPDCPAE